MKAKNKRGKLILVMMLLIIFVLSSCGKDADDDEKKNVTEYSYKNEKIADYITIAKTEYYDDKVIIYGTGFTEDLEVVRCYDSSFQTIEDDYTAKVSGKKITIKIEDAKRISGIFITGNDVEYKLRYLDSNQYAILWYYFVCDLGFEEYGDTSSYYTQDEINEKNAAIEAAKEKLAKNFAVIEGNWEGQWNDEWSGNEHFLAFWGENDKFYLSEGSIYEQGPFVYSYPIIEIELTENEDGKTDVMIDCNAGDMQCAYRYILSEDGTMLALEYNEKDIYCKTDKTIEEWEQEANAKQEANNNLVLDLEEFNEYSIIPVKLGEETDLSYEIQLGYSQDMPYTFYNYNPEEGYDMEDFEAYGYFYGDQDTGKLRCMEIDTRNSDVEILMLHIGVTMEQAEECLVDYFEYEKQEFVENEIEGCFVEFIKNQIHVTCYFNTESGEIYRIRAYIDNGFDFVE